MIKFYHSLFAALPPSIPKFAGYFGLLLLALPALLPAQVDSSPDLLNLNPVHHSQRTPPVPVNTWTQWESQSWEDSSSTWETFRLIDYVRDGQNRPTLIIEKAVTNGIPENKFRYSFVFTGNPLMSWERFTEQWQPGGFWLLTETYQEEFDLQGNLITATDVSWATGSPDTVQVIRDLHTYNASTNNLIETIREVRGQSLPFVPTTRELRTYNAANEMDTLEAFTWQGGQWVPTTRDIFPQWFDYGLDLPTETFRQEYQGASGYVNVWRRTFAYGANNSWVENFADWENNAWLLETLIIAEFDAQNRLTYYSLSSANTTPPTIQIADSSIYTYNVNLQPTERIFRTYGFTQPPAWENGRRDLYRYNTVNLPEPKDRQSLVLFPQPAGDELRLKAPTSAQGNHELILYDLQGRQVKAWKWEQSNTTQTSWDLTGLSPGIYTYRILGPDGSQSGKLVKE